MYAGIPAIRDFKPDNVLLGRDPATGELRAQVADFGLARRDDDSEEARGRESEVVLHARNSLLDQGLTRVGAVMGTPRYMSPEQHAGTTVDPRSDQFSYCVALYEALYGELPFTGDTLEELAQAASQGRRRLPSAGSDVPGWLGRVCLRGLQPDREARFADMEALLSEVARGLGRRRSLWFAAAGAVVLVGALGAAAGAMREGPGEPRCAGGPGRLAGVWDAAVQEQGERAFMATGAVYAKEAWKTARVRVDHFGAEWLTMYRDSCEASERGEQSSELMDLRTACLGRALQDLGALTRLYVAADVQVVRRAMDMALTLPALAGCADVGALRSVGDAPPPEQAAAIEGVRGSLAQARAQGAAGMKKEALAGAIAAEQAARGMDYLPLSAEAKLTLAATKYATGEHEAALLEFRSAVAAALAARDDAMLLTGLLRMATTSGYNLGRTKEGMAWIELARGVVQRRGNARRDVVRLLDAEALIDIAVQRYAQAQALLVRELELLEAEYGADSARLEEPTSALGSVYLRTGRYVEAQSLLTRAVELAEADGGPLHPDVVPPLNNLALSYERQGRRMDAVATLRRAKEILERTSGADDPSVGVLQQNIGGMLRLAGKPKEARAELDASRRLLEAKLGLEHPALAAVYSFSGDVALDQGDLARARADFQRADDLRRRVLGPEHPDRALALLGLGKVALAEGKPGAAVAPIELALRLYKDRTPDPQDVGELKWTLARALWANDEARARGLMVEARASFVEAGVNSAGLVRELDAWTAAHPGG